MTLAKSNPEQINIRLKSLLSTLCFGILVPSVYGSSEDPSDTPPVDNIGAYINWLSDFQSINIAGTVKLQEATALSTDPPKDVTINFDYKESLKNQRFYFEEISPDKNPDIINTTQCWDGKHYYYFDIPTAKLGTSKIRSLQHESIGNPLLLPIEFAYRWYDESDFISLVDCQGCETSKKFKLWSKKYISDISPMGTGTKIQNPKDNTDNIEITWGTIGKYIIPKKQVRTKQSQVIMNATFEWAISASGRPMLTSIHGEGHDQQQKAELSYSFNKAEWNTIKEIEIFFDTDRAKSIIDYDNKMEIQH
jgi:hypothetical protein